MIIMEWTYFICASNVAMFQLGWAVYAAKSLRPQCGPISHPQKVGSKYWVLNSQGRNSKEPNYPRSPDYITSRVTSPRPSNYSSLKRGYLRITNTKVSISTGRQHTLLCRSSVLAMVEVSVRHILTLSKRRKLRTLHCKFLERLMFQDP